MKSKIGIGVIVFIFVVLCMNVISENTVKNKIYGSSSTMRVISSEENKDLDNIIKECATDEGITLDIEYESTLDIIEKLNNGESYDAVWISNSMWLYMLNSNIRVSDSKIININPIVFGIRKKKAKELGFTERSVSLEEIINAISTKKLSFATTNATQTNTGASSYLSFLSILAGNPEVLKTDHLKNPEVKEKLKNLYQNVNRTSGNEEYLEGLFKKGSIDSFVTYESSVINYNKNVKNDDDLIYAIYPLDGVAISDGVFAYLGETNTEQEEAFLALQKDLLSKEVQNEMIDLGKRTWYGGTNKDAPREIFNPKYGIDTNRYLNQSKYPSKDIIKKALNLYQTELRKPVSLVFALDYSGSMYGTGEKELKKAMEYVLNSEEAENNYIQFTENDKVALLTFSDRVSDITSAPNGSNTTNLLELLDKREPDGTTNIYDSVTKSIKFLENEDTNKYNVSIVLMTDGYGNTGSKEDMYNAIKNSKIKIPVYGILFANATDSQLKPIAEKSGGEVFDGSSDLVKAFKVVRGFN